MLDRPLTLDDKLLAVIDATWRTAREVFDIVDEGAPVTVKTRLAALSNAGLVDRRYDPHRNQQIARYRRLPGPSAAIS